MDECRWLSTRDFKSRSVWCSDLKSAVKKKLGNAPVNPRVVWVGRHYKNHLILPPTPTRPGCSMWKKPVLSQNQIPTCEFSSGILHFLAGQNMTLFSENVSITVA